MLRFIAVLVVIVPVAAFAQEGDDEEAVAAPADCSDDSDCATGEICLTETVQSCSSGGCVCPDNGEACDCEKPAEPIDEECTEETYSYCVPQWVAPCDVDADCGDGFTCVATEICTCTATEGEEGDRAPEENCECAPGDEKACQLNRIECSSAADCPIGIDCVLESEDSEVKVCGFLALPIEEGEEGTGEERANDDLGSDEIADDDDGVEGCDVELCCSQSSAGGLAPFAAVAFLVLRRRRR